MDRPAQDPEKAGFDNADEIRSSSNDSQGIDVDASFTPEEQRRIIRRIDRRLVVTVGAMYCVSLMDRTNLSAAAIAGMTKELSLYLDDRYSIASLLFFVPYIIFQPPSTIIVRKVGPRLHLGGLTLLWGGVMIGMGFSRRYTHLYACRILLGVLEAGFFPSCVYLLSTWYTRCKSPVQVAFTAQSTDFIYQTRSGSVTRSSTSSDASLLPSPVSLPTASCR